MCQILSWHTPVTLFKLHKHHLKHKLLYISQMKKELRFKRTLNSFYKYLLKAYCVPATGIEH